MPEDSDQTKAGSAELRLRRLEIFVGLGKFVAGTLVLGAFSLFLSNQIEQQELALKQREVEQLEMQTFGEFVSYAVSENAATRLRLATYFSVVASSESVQARWQTFEDIAQRELDSLRSEASRIATIEAQPATTAVTRDSLEAERKSVESQLIPKVTVGLEIFRQFAPLVRGN